MAQIEKKVTLPILGYYDEKIKDWVVNQIDNTAQADWAETDEFSSSYIKNKPENLVTGANLEFKRLNEEGNEDNTIDSVSVVVNGNVVNKFFSSHDRIQANVSFIASEVKTFFEDAGITPDTYDGSTWTEEIISIANMTAENGPYLVFITNNAEDTAEIHAHVKSMKNALSNYATAQYVDEKDKNNVKYNNNNVEFKNHAVVPFGSGLYGTSPDLGWTLLAAVKGYNLETEEKFIQSEFGSASLHTNINSKDRPTIETADGKEEIAYLSDIEEEVFYIQIPIRTLQDKVYTQEEILKWFGVQDIPELKTKITRNYLPILKYGITLSYNPHFYKMIVEYLAFESANQIKLVFSGLNTSNDDASKYEIIINLDGTIIEGNSNIKLSQLQLIDEETLRTEIENATQLEII